MMTKGVFNFMGLLTVIRMDLEGKYFNIIDSMVSTNFGLWETHIYAPICVNDFFIGFDHDPYNAKLRSLLYATALATCF